MIFNQYKTKGTHTETRARLRETLDLWGHHQFAWDVSPRATRGFSWLIFYAAKRTTILFALQFSWFTNMRQVAGFRHGVLWLASARDGHWMKWANMSPLFVTVVSVLFALSVSGSLGSDTSSFIQPFNDCIHSRGKAGFYQGSVDVTESGGKCMNWSEVPGVTSRYPGKGLGDHNFCRNPDGRIRPWCFFRNERGRIDWGYCDCKQGKVKVLSYIWPNS